MSLPGVEKGMKGPGRDRMQEPQSLFSRELGGWDYCGASSSWSRSRVEKMWTMALTLGSRVGKWPWEGLWSDLSQEEVKSSRGGIGRGNVPGNSFGA